jgi:hypothetical protein
VACSTPTTTTSANQGKAGQWMTKETGPCMRARMPGYRRGLDATRHLTHTHLGNHQVCQGSGCQVHLPDPRQSEVVVVNGTVLQHVVDVGNLGDVKLGGEGAGQWKACRKGKSSRLDGWGNGGGGGGQYRGTSQRSTPHPSACGRSPSSASSIAAGPATWIRLHSR